MSGPAKSSPSSPGAPAIGTIVGGRYRVVAILGEGGMGVVARARHDALEEDVAIKFLKDWDRASDEGLERFLREARAAVKIKNPHIVRVFDVGLHEGAPFIAMEYVDGEPLGDRVHEKGPFDASTAVDLTLQACDAMADAHANGIVHRDLKPNNLMLTRRGDGRPFVKVLDFGLATAPSREGDPVRITTTEVSFGSPAYMPPEQIRSARNADERSDVWALGVILYELLTGRLPFSGDNAPGMLAAIAADTHRPLTELRPDLAGLDAVIDCCLRKNPADRYASVAALAGALAPFASPDGASAAARAGRPRGVGTSSPESAPPPSRRDPAVVDHEAKTLEVRGAPPRPSSSAAIGLASTVRAAPDALRTTPLSEGRSNVPYAVIALVVMVGGAVAWRWIDRHAAATATTVPPSAVSVAPPVAQPPPQPIAADLASASDANPPTAGLSVAAGASGLPATSASAPTRAKGAPGRAGGAGGAGRRMLVDAGSQDDVPTSNSRL